MIKNVSLLQVTPDYSIYLFINSGSGGNKGRSIVNLQIETLHFKIDQKDIMICMYDLLDPPMRKKGFMKLKESSETHTFSRAIICGGDGSVMWVIEEMIRHQVRLDRVPIGIIPIGTGNDFSRALGWGGEQTSTIGVKLGKLKALCEQWIRSDVEPFDVWEMHLSTFENGSISKASVSKEKTKDDNQQQLSKAFCNYMSLGIDGRIGYTFDKYRTASRFMNLLVYGAIGAKKMFDKAMPLDKYISRMEVLNGNGPPLIIFDNDDPECPYKLDHALESMLALNIDSYMGGVKNIWKAKKVGISNYVADNPPTGVSFNDGRLEFVGWASECDLGLQRTMSTAYKINQSSGPFRFVFKENEDSSHHTYMQVDGEYYKVFHPKELIIQRISTIPHGSIRVMRNIQ